MSATVTCAWCNKSGHPDSHWTFDEDVALWFCCGECCSSHADEQDYDKLRARAEKAEARVKELEAQLDAARKLCGEAADQLTPSMCPCGKCGSLQKRLRAFAGGA